MWKTISNTATTAQPPLARLLYHHPRARRWLFHRAGQQVVEAITDVAVGTRTYRGSLAHLFEALALRPFRSPLGARP